MAFSRSMRAVAAHFGLRKAATLWRRVSILFTVAIGLLLTTWLPTSAAPFFGIAALVVTFVTLVLFFVASSRFAEEASLRILEMP